MTIQEKLGVLYAIIDCENRGCGNCTALKTCRGNAIDKEFQKKLILEISRELTKEEQPNDQEN